MSAITYLRLDSSNDPIFYPSAALSDLDAVAQAIRTRILLFEGEWWEDLNDGTPMFQEILGAPAGGPNRQIMELALTQRIAQTPYVSSVQDVSIEFNTETRELSFSATAQTAFGTASVNNSNFSAGLGQ